MTTFLRWTLIYFIAASAVNFVLRGDGLFTLFKVLTTSGSVSSLMVALAPVAVILMAVSYRTSQDIREFATRIALSLGAIAICSVFLASFSSLKTAMPFMVEVFGLSHFFADPFFADLDNVLHFGTDPWVWTHAATQFLGWSNFASHASTLYGLWWAIPAFYLPAMMILIGEDKATFRHYLILYFFAWVVLGNIVAPASFSAGPIYYDTIFGTERYAALYPAMVLGGIEGSWIGRVQPLLWEAYVTNDQAVGGGISAFPSLHIALAMLTAIYLHEKSKWFSLIGVPFVLAMLFISVWTGYHYAIDGYFSVLAVYAAHRYLKRRPAQAADRQLVKQSIEAAT